MLLFFVEEESKNIMYITNGAHSLGLFITIHVNLCFVYPGSQLYPIELKVSDLTKI